MASFRRVHGRKLLLASIGVATATYMGCEETNSGNLMGPPCDPYPECSQSSSSGGGEGGQGGTGGQGGAGGSGGQTSTGGMGGAGGTGGSGGGMPDGGM